MRLVPLSRAFRLVASVVMAWPLSVLAAGIKPHSRPLALLVLAAFLWAPSVGATDGPYTYVDLGTLGPANSVAFAINNAGQIVGASVFAEGSPLQHATLWEGGTVIDLGTPSGWSSVATAVNDTGHVAGSSSFGGVGRATLWGGAGPIDLGTLGGSVSFASGINNAGQVVGTSATAGNLADHATLWSGGSLTDLDPTGTTVSVAYDINNAGQIVGSSVLGGTLWSGTTAVALGTLGGSSLPIAINDAGQIAGVSTPAEGGVRATLWNGTAPTELFTTGTDSAAYGINNAGQIVGVDLSTGAVLWDGPVATDLNGFLDAETVAAGWRLGDARGINDSGWIVGYAFNTITSQQHAYLLIPIPEPDIHALMLAGMGALGFVAYRRKVADRGGGRSNARLSRPG